MNQKDLFVWLYFSSLSLERVLLSLKTKNTCYYLLVFLQANYVRSFFHIKLKLFIDIYNNHGLCKKLCILILDIFDLNCEIIKRNNLLLSCHVNFNLSYTKYILQNFLDILFKFI